MHPEYDLWHYFRSYPWSFFYVKHIDFNPLDETNNRCPNQPLDRFDTMNNILNADNPIFQIDDRIIIIKEMNEANLTQK